MAFRIKPNESVSQAIRRMARAELADAIRAVRSRNRKLGDRVHEVRTALKKTRALARLVQPAVGKPARHADRRLREVGRRLSAVRDAEVLLGTFDSLLPAIGAPTPPELQRSRAALSARLQEKARPFRGKKSLAKMEADLRRARRRVKRWTPRSGEWRIVGSGLVSGYRKARRTMAAAYVEDSGAAFHAWRRAVKRHRYQARILEEIGPDEIDRLAALDRLGELLGQEHDLTVLAETIDAERTCFADQQDCERLLTVLAERQRDLRDAAQPLGKRIFAERPKAFARRVRSYLRGHRPQATETAATVH